MPRLQQLALFGPPVDVEWPDQPTRTAGYYLTDFGGDPLAAAIFVGTQVGQLHRRLITERSSRRGFGACTEIVAYAVGVVRIAQRAGINTDALVDRHGALVREPRA